MRILLCTNGTRYAARAMTLGTRIAVQLMAAVDVLALPTRRTEEATHQMVSAAGATLDKAGLESVVHWRRGRLPKHLLRQNAALPPYDLVVMGSRGRRGIVAKLLGSIAHQVIGHAPASVLVVKGREREQLREFLVCTAAGPTSVGMVRFAGKLARELGARVTLLHVMSQVPVTSGAQLGDLDASVSDLIRSGSREGVHLNAMMTLLAEQGVLSRVVVRRGLVLDEIAAESQDEPYDLIVAGAHITPGLKSFLVEDLAGRIVLAANSSVLIVRTLPVAEGVP